MLADIDKETVDFAPNYDGSEKEPTVLPARLPNLLINGSAGIAVGMATNIPPHNLNEIVDACLHLLKSPQATLEELMEIVPAPDFPTAGIVRHRGKIESTINNAGRALVLRDEFGSIFDYVSRFRPARSTRLTVSGDLFATCPESVAMSKDLKKRGWSFVGPTTMYAFMQAMGLVNDHIEGCEREA